MTLKVPYSEKVARGTQGSPMFGASLEAGFTGTRHFHVLWSDALLAIQQLVGYSFAAFVADPLTGLEKRVLRRELPEIYPSMPRCICVDARVVECRKWTGRTVFNPEGWSILDRAEPPVVQGFPNNDPNTENRLWKENTYQQATIKAEYKQVEYDVCTDDEIDRIFGGSEFFRFRTTKTDRSARYLTLPGSTMRWIVPPPPRLPNEADAAYEKRRDELRLIPFGVGVIECDEVLYITQHQVSEDAIPFNTLSEGMGKVNKFTWRGYLPGTLLALPYKTTRKCMPGGTLQQIGVDLEHQFVYNKKGHNKLLRFIKGVDELRKYYYATIDDNIVAEPDPENLPDGKFLHDTVDFSQFFIPANS